MRNLKLCKVTQERESCLLQKGHDNQRHLLVARKTSHRGGTTDKTQQGPLHRKTMFSQTDEKKGGCSTILHLQCDQLQVVPSN